MKKSILYTLIGAAGLGLVQASSAALVVDNNTKGNDLFVSSHSCSLVGLMNGCGLLIRPNDNRVLLKGKWSDSVYVYVVQRTKQPVLLASCRVPIHVTKGLRYGYRGIYLPTVQTTDLLPSNPGQVSSGSTFCNYIQTNLGFF